MYNIKNNIKICYKLLYYLQTCHNSKAVCILLSLKMTQNFNRTHPMRTELYSSIDKKKRINKRRKNKNMDYFGLFEND